ncbi:hypothetical protein F3Y22_tig00110893pilonHSYRG00153 [Hibiscus syriacus]|uniref:Aminotransferase-like plant mobile domain-containing protein n=1 Tax=Hibiscus syriacus TaxID=106335 RepID=A0A6A2ZG00_HIBSY|nr:hypothetical protein F3Y22_tig00110893pilonHSYRG00153 [Hibiscus syriacus]
MASRRAWRSSWHPGDLFGVLHGCAWLMQREPMFGMVLGRSPGHPSDIVGHQGIPATCMLCMACANEAFTCSALAAPLVPCNVNSTALLQHLLLHYGSTYCCIIAALQLTKGEDSKGKEEEEERESTTSRFIPMADQIPLLRLDNEHISSHLGIMEDEQRVLRLRLHKVPKPHPLIEENLQEVGFWYVTFVRDYKLVSGLISALIERWRPETHTFHLPGECTITLEDVAMQLGVQTNGMLVVMSHEFNNVAQLCSLFLGKAPVPPECRGWRVRSKHKIEGTGLVHNNIKEFRLKIDIKAKKEFNWRPYINAEIFALVSHDILDGFQYWCVVTPLINFAFVEIQFGDRVLRQFHVHQPILRSLWDHDLLQNLDGRRQVNWVETHDDLHRFDGRRKENVNWVEKHATYINAWNNRASFMSTLDNNQDDDFNFETPTYLAYFWDNGKPFLTTMVERRQFFRFKKRFGKTEYSLPSVSGSLSQQPEAEMTDVDNSVPQPFDDTGSLHHAFDDSTVPAYIPEFVQSEAPIYSPMFSSSYDFEHMAVQMPPMNEEDGYHTPEQPQQPQRIRRPPRHYHSTTPRHRQQL